MFDKANFSGHQVHYVNIMLYASRLGRVKENHKESFLGFEFPIEIANTKVRATSTLTGNQNDDVENENKSN